MGVEASACFPLEVVQGATKKKKKVYKHTFNLRRTIMKYLPLAADNFLMELVLFLVEVEVLALVVVELKCEILQVLFK